MEYVIKRNGDIVKYDKSKIENAIYRAAIETDETNPKGLSGIIAHNVEAELLINFNDEKLPNVEQIQDIVELEIMQYDNGSCAKVAKAYILYRDKHNENRNKKWLEEDLPLSIWENKYRYKNETFEEFFDRISNGNQKIRKNIKEKKFMPAGRILANRGLQKDGKKITYSNCYVVSPPEDNIENIFDTAKMLARTFSYGGGAGIDISKLRPKGSAVNNAAESTSGAVSFMPLYSLTTDTICQMGRRGALMISLDIDHPEIEEFINIKNDLSAITKANISLKITDEFMEAVKKNEEFELSFYVDSTGEEIIKRVDARKIFNKIAYSNWNMGEPGFLFWDRISNWNLLSEDDEFEYAGVNPCAEEPLPAGGSCLLGSLNLSAFIKNEYSEDAYFDFDDFKTVIFNSVEYLNEVLDEGLPLHPLKEQQDSVSDYRQIGLGIMGLSDMFIKMGVKYGSQDSLILSKQIGEVLINYALQSSALLAKIDGSYPKYKEKEVMSSPFLKANVVKETYDMIKKYGLRNSQILTIAPNGSISTMLGISGGIEPIFDISYKRTTKTLHEEDVIYEVFTPIVKKYMKKNNIYDKKDLPSSFVTAHTLDHKQRIDMQAIWQSYIDASISSTVNLDNSATIQDIKDIYQYAWEKGLKGITVFRNGCARAGILTTNNGEVKEEMEEDDFIEQGICPECQGELNFTGGCKECRSCGYSPCSI